MLGIEQESAACKANNIPTVLSLQPKGKVFIVRDWAISKGAQGSGISLIFVLRGQKWVCGKSQHYPDTVSASCREGEFSDFFSHSLQVTSGDPTNSLRGPACLLGMSGLTWIKPWITGLGYPGGGGVDRKGDNIHRTRFHPAQEQMSHQG